MPQNVESAFDPMEYASNKLKETDTEFDPMEYASSKLKEDAIKTEINNKIAINGEPDDNFVENTATFFKDYAYQSADIYKGLFKGSQKAIINTGKFIADVTGKPDMKNWLDDVNKDLDLVLDTTSKAGDVAEVVGQVGTGLFATGGFGVATVPARMTQGFAVDLLAFDEKSGNIADVFNNYDIQLGGVVEYLKSNPNDGAIEARFKNAISGALTGGALESIFSGFKYGKQLIADKGIELKGTDAEIVSTVMSTLKEEANTMASKVPDIPVEQATSTMTKAQFNEGEALYNRATEMIKDVPENYDELVARGQGVFNKDTTAIRQSEADTIVKQADSGLLEVDTLKNTPFFKGLDVDTQAKLVDSLGGEDFFRIMEGIQSDISKIIKVNVDTVDATLNLKQPLNAEKITPSNAETLAKATQDIEADADFISHQELLKKADSDLKTKLGQEGYDLVSDLTETASKVENLSLKVTQARVVVGNLAQVYQDALKVAQKEGGAESTMRAMLALDNLVMTSKILKNSTSSVAKAMSAMRINTEESQLFNSLKIMDSIDTDYSMSLLREAIAKGDNEAVIKLMDNFSDSTKKLKDHVDNYQEGWFKKTGNVLSEAIVASMLSAPSTLAVNIIGNTYVKHQRLLRDSLQFVTGKILRNSDRMKDREFKYLLSANIGSNFNDLRLVGKNLTAWAKSGFKDEVFDETVLARFVQDQEFQHKYVSSQYIRGMELGNQSSLFNTSINVFGKLARSPYKVIGAVDDYYKRSAFRSELVRVGSRLADIRNIPDADYNKFMDKFIRVNTELHILRNNGHKPTTTFLKQNKDYIGTGDGLFKYADEARDHANYMTFQSELKGAIGKGVDFLNSDGFLRILVPFKLTPINMLKQSLSTVHDTIRQELYKDIFVIGGIKRDIAIAKLAYSSSVMLGIGSLIQSGNMTGTFKKEERNAMRSAGIPEYSYRVGNTWYEYKQLEPIATIAGVMTDLFRLQNDAMLRSSDIPSDEIGQEVQNIIADVGMSIVNNIVNKTYAKSLSDALDVISGNKNIIDYSGNLISSAVPMSSLANFIGREFGDGYKKESSEFTEKVFSKYRVALERDALDAYGRPIKEVDYSPVLTKVVEANRPENIGAVEVARLGIEIRELPKIVSYQGISVKLQPEEYWQMRRNLDTKFGLSDKLNTIVSSDSYKAQSDYVKTQMLSSVINQIKLGASQSIISDTRVTDKLQEGVGKLVKKVNDVEPKATYNNMILGEGK